MPVSEKDPAKTRTQKPYEKPAGKVVGTIGELLQGGMGKLSPAPKDPGEDKKVPAQDGG